MNEECIYINNLIIEYTNNTITKENNNILLNHLALCSECRKELALVLMLSKTIKNQSKDVPVYIMENAFSLIAKEQIVRSNNSLDDLKSSLITLKDVLSTAKKSIRFAIQFI